MRRCGFVYDSAGKSAVLNYYIVHVVCSPPSGTIVYIYVYQTRLKLHASNELILIQNTSIRKVWMCIGFFYTQNVLCIFYKL